jgi:hypothetical protein
MKFPIIVTESDIPPLIERFIQIAGAPDIQKKFIWINRELAENEHVTEWLHEYHGIEIELQKLLLGVKQTGTFPISNMTTEQNNLYTFVAGFVRIYEQLSEKGQKRFRGMLLDGLKTDKGLASLKHEVMTAINLVCRGYDVEFNDIENGAGFDYIARRDGMEIEIECKVFTGDLGRQIHKRNLVSLQKLLLPQLKGIFSTASKGILIRVVLPGRLTPNKGQATKIVDSISHGILSGNKQSLSDACNVEVLDFAIQQSPFNVPLAADLDKNEVITFVSRLIGVAKLNPNLAIIFSPNKHAVILLIESAVSDKVLKGMYRQLSSAASGQFSGTRPGILAIHINALSGDQLIALYNLSSSDPLNPTGLRVMTSRFLEDPSRQHIHTVSYEARGRIIFNTNANYITEKGSSYFIRNPKNLSFGDERCQVFASNSPQ